MKVKIYIEYVEVIDNVIQFSPDNGWKGVSIIWKDGSKWIPHDEIKKIEFIEDDSDEK